MNIGKLMVAVVVLLFLTGTANAQENMENVKLTPFEKFIIEDKGTERPFTGEYWDHFEDGSYHCKRCGALLYRSSDKFDGHCGWPSFDDEVKGAIKREVDADGYRTEILCANCDAHLGHVFAGEGFTDKNIRHCVNSASLDFVAEKKEYATAVFASGCFWGTEYHLAKKKGVIETTVGYTGGKTENPSYDEVCTGKTGHVEAVKVIYDPSVVSYRDLLVLFFETHDFTQVNGQGPDIGSQYLSRVFYFDTTQKETAEKTIRYLEEKKNYKIATRVLPEAPFYPAENYHQDYYEMNGSSPYCHIWRPVF